MRKLPNFDRRLQGAFREVAHAMARLDEKQGLVGRRNARQALSKAERRLRKAVDELYPAMKRKAKPRRKTLTVEQRRQRLEKEGWKVVHSASVAAQLSAAGVKTRTLRDSDRHHTLWTPRWAAKIIRHRPKKLATASKSIVERRAILTELALDHGDADLQKYAGGLK